MRRRRPAEAFEVEGVGVHFGKRARVRVAPAPWGHGRRFRVGDEVIEARIDSALARPGATVLVGEHAEVSTPEHLLAALVGLGITDAVIEVVGPELPILDGSSLPWCAALRGVGIEVGPKIAPYTLPGVVRVEEAGGVGVAEPSTHLSVEVDVDFEGGPRGTLSVELDAFESDVAPARTFVLERDIGRLRAAGLGRGADRHNTVVWGVDGPLGPTRFEDEPVRHKLLDLLGDLALLGAPVVARIRASRGSHRLHHALVREILASASPPIS